jgi:ArsR family transcriptional regulator
MPVRAAAALRDVPARAKHLKVLVNAGVLAAERRGAWAFYSLVPGATQELAAWLG